ncbi:MAG: tetratricopeptide repeat protein [Candidatus Rokubacteria bacterium]|nr:tetratricopeptide repeat protein [Candidatus Rokubacteria bacterium]
MIVRLLPLVLVWLGLVGAAAPKPLPLVPPLPDLTALVPWVSAPLDKPPVVPPDLAPPPPAAELPPPPPPVVVVPAAEKPVAFLSPPRALPCVGAWLRIASESFECGRARFAKGEYEDAYKALDQAVRGAGDPDLAREARYWLGETLVRLGRIEQADWLFRQVAQDAPRHEPGLWGLHSSGWTALRLGDASRAREAFAQLLGGVTPTSLGAWARHGLGLASYALGRWEEAERTWSELKARGVPGALARDVEFWHGETLGRLGEHARAVSALRGFSQGGPHPLLEAGLLRLGWWSLAAGQSSDAATAFRAYLGAPLPGGRAPAAAGERDWGDAGLALSLLASGDWDGARNALRPLQARRAPLVLPVLLRLTAAAIESRRPTDARALVQELLAGTLEPGVRAWVLLMSGEAYRADGNRDEARTQYDLARSPEPASEIATLAQLRLAQTNFELREFRQAAADLSRVLTGTPSPEMRAVALLLLGEAAYRAEDWAAAEAAYRQALVEFPDHSQARATRLALAWTALRRDRTEEAQRLFLEFADAFGSEPGAADALVLASELLLANGDVERARQVLDRTIAAYPGHPRTDFARLNQAILLVRSGRGAEAEASLRDWLKRAPFPPLLGRARLALGAALLAAARYREAAAEFAAAEREGFTAFARLGLGVAGLGQARWDDAQNALARARATGTAAVAGAAEYGLAVVAFHRGGVGEFTRVARAALDAAPAGPLAPGLLYVLTGIAVQEKDLFVAFETAKRLVAEFPSHVTAPDALERVGAGAAAVPLWPIVYETYTLLRQRYPTSPWVEASRLTLATARLETGRADEARRDLEQLVTVPLALPESLHAWTLLARAREATGDRRGALDAYERIARDHPGAEPRPETVLAHGKLLVEERRWADARQTLERLVRSERTEVVVEAARAVGETWEAEGQHVTAAEYYMTAAYLLPGSPSGRQALLAAARSFAALKQRGAAEIVYRKLLTEPNLPADLADAARRGLEALPR